MLLFVAAPLPLDVRERLAGLCAGLPRTRWVEPHNMHITLRFIGEVDGDAAEDADAALAQVRHQAFDLGLAGIGHFGSGRRVRSVWAGVEGADKLVHLRHKVESALVRAGHDPEHRKFHPHVTLAHLKNAPAARIGDYAAAHNGFAVPPFRVERFTLFESRRGNERVHYEALAEYPLAS
ncbi:MAG: RNA 2',3'-cyclic phosphodiesterase [Rhodospirillales bacterium]|jgi:2'-5' RNA ligase|nr:RNA 2',3'-cyclic phosphodiesterase [Rhodospirillales bacterium]